MELSTKKKGSRWSHYNLHFTTSQSASASSDWLQRWLFGQMGFTPTKVPHWTIQRTFWTWFGFFLEIIIVIFFLSVWKVQHHDSYPSFVLSCANDGTMLLWDLQPKGRADDLPQIPAIAELFNVGLSINSFDIELDTNTLICCSDNESLSLEVLNLY